MNEMLETIKKRLGLSTDYTGKTQNVNYMNPNYSQQELNAKLDRLYQNIQGNSEEVEKIKAGLQQLARYGIGQRTIMQMPENVKFKVDNYSYLESIDAGACYSKKEKHILLPANFSSFTSWQVVALAHEMRHAIQDANGRMRVKSPYPSDEHVQEKMCEMETKLQDIVFESQMKAETNDVKTPACRFYEAELKRYQEAGLSQKEAEQAARTSVVQVYWSGLNEKPTGCSEITQDLRDDVNYWTNYYDISSFAINNYDNEFDFKKAKLTEPYFDGADVREAENVEQKQAFDMTYQAVISILTIEAKTYLESSVGDF